MDLSFSDDKILLTVADDKLFGVQLLELVFERVAKHRQNRLPTRSSLSAHVIFFEDSTCLIWRATPILFWREVATEKMAVNNTFGPVSINGWCAGYILADHN